MYSDNEGVDRNTLKRRLVNYNKELKTQEARLEKAIRENKKKTQADAAFVINALRTSIREIEDLLK